MITLHPEQHIRHRKQRQCHKQVNPTPSHKRKPHKQDPYQCHCKPPTSKILVNENTRTTSLPHTQKPPAPNPSPNQHQHPPLILPHHHLKSLRIHQTPLSATIHRQPLDKLRRPRMRIRPHHAPVHRKRLHLRIHTLLADLHITIRIERHHRTVALPLRTRRHLHIPELPHTPLHQTTPKQPDHQRISKSAPLQLQPNNNPCQCQCHLQTPTTSSKKPNTPHANDNTSSRTAHTPQKAAPMPQTNKSNAKPQAKAHKQTPEPDKGK